MVGRSEMWTLLSLALLLLVADVAVGQNHADTIYNPPMVNINKNGKVPCLVPMSLPVAVKGCKEYEFNMGLFEQVDGTGYYCSGVNLTVGVPYDIVFNRTCKISNTKLSDNNSLPCVRFEFNIDYRYNMTVKFTDDLFMCNNMVMGGAIGIYPFRINRINDSADAVDKFDSSADIFDALNKIVNDDIQVMDFNSHNAEVVKKSSAFEEFVDPFLCDSSCFWFALGATVICLGLLVACLIVSGKVGNSRTSPKGIKKAKAARKSMKSKASVKDKNSKASKTKKSTNSNKESKVQKSVVESKATKEPNDNTAVPSAGSAPLSHTGSETNVERTPSK